MTDILPWISPGNLLLVIGYTNLHLRLATKLKLIYIAYCCVYIYTDQKSNANYISINSISDVTQPLISDNRTIIARLTASTPGAY